MASLVCVVVDLEGTIVKVNQCDLDLHLHIFEIACFELQSIFQKTSTSVWVIHVKMEAHVTMVLTATVANALMGIAVSIVKVKANSFLYESK